MKHRAFTLIEIIIVIMVVAILSTGLALSFSNGRGQAAFKDAQYQITNIIQEARALSLSNVLIEDTGVEADYYLLDITASELTLTAYGMGESAAVEHEIQSVTLSDGVEIDSGLQVYYIPPYGDLCFTYAGICNYTTTESSFTLIRENSDQTATFTLSIYSGYPEIN